MIVRRSRSMSDQRSPSTSPRRSPKATASTNAAYSGSLLAASRKVVVSSRSHGFNSRDCTRGAGTSLTTFLLISSSRQAGLHPGLTGPELRARARSRTAPEACGFDFEAMYGPRGAGYIECHHVVPLHEAGEGWNKLSDLALICANCHRMIHRRAPWPTPGDLRASIEQKHADDRRAAEALARPRRVADEHTPHL